MEPALKTLFKILRIICSVGFVVCVLVAGLSWFEKGRLGKPAAMDPSLLREPVQGPTSREPFQFEYMGEVYNVRPFASYEIWGLVVTHNNTEGFGDIYHDATSVDTKDLCMIWGANLQGEDYRHADYWSGSWTCYVKVPAGRFFAMEALSNSHLITDSDDIRERISQVRVGDQVRVSGLLVGYQAESNPGFWRDSSLVRTDTGNGACEVIFVEDLEIIRKGTPLFYLAFTLSLWLGGFFILGYLGVLVAETHSTPKIQYSSRWG